jgi:hypothetical protein
MSVLTLYNLIQNKLHPESVQKKKKMEIKSRTLSSLFGQNDNRKSLTSMMNSKQNAKKTRKTKLMWILYSSFFWYHFDFFFKFFKR